jgi:hypothetical protein
MFNWSRRAIAVALFSASLFASFEARATHVKIVSGLIGGQDDESKRLLALPPAEADQAATHDLLSVLRPTGKFTVDNSRNVEAMTFTTPPYQTEYRYVCRQDRVTLQYTLEDRHNAAGVWSGFGHKPVGVEAQQTYHVEQLPVPGFIPGSSYLATVCDANHPEITATWFAAPSATDAVRAANMFRMAEDEVKAGRLTPGPCDSHGSDTCSQWVLSLDDSSKITSIQRCETKTDNDACYVISRDTVDITITGTIPRTEPEPVVPTAITSVRVDAVVTISG